MNTISRKLSHLIHSILLLGLSFSTSLPAVQAVSKPEKYNLQWVLNQLDHASYRFKKWGRERIAQNLQRLARPTAMQAQAIKKWAAGELLSPQEKVEWVRFRNRALRHPGSVALIATIIISLLGIGAWRIGLFSRKEKKDEKEQQKMEQMPQEEGEEQQKIIKDEKIEKEEKELGRQKMEQKLMQEEDEKQQKKIKKEKVEAQIRLEKQKKELKAKKIYEKRKKEKAEKDELEIIKRSYLTHEKMPKNAYLISSYLESPIFKEARFEIEYFFSNLKPNIKKLFPELLSSEGRLNLQTALKLANMDPEGKEKYRVEVRKKQKEQEFKKELAEWKFIERDESSQEFVNETPLILVTPIEHWQNLKKEIINYSSTVKKEFPSGKLITFKKDSLNKLLESLKDDRTDVADLVKMVRETETFTGSQGLLTMLMNEVNEVGTPVTFQGIEGMVKGGLQRIKRFELKPTELYDFLGVTPAATTDEIKEAIKKKAEELKGQYQSEELEWLQRQLNYLFGTEKQKKLYDLYLKGPDGVKDLKKNEKAIANRDDQVIDITELKMALLELAESLKERIKKRKSASQESEQKQGYLEYYWKRLMG